MFIVKFHKANMLAFGAQVHDATAISVITTTFAVFKCMAVQAGPNAYMEALQSAVLHDDGTVSASSSSAEEQSGPLMLVVVPGCRP
jgi:hypothetical protein